MLATLRIRKLVAQRLLTTFHCSTSEVISSDLRPRRQLLSRSRMHCGVITDVTRFHSRNKIFMASCTVAIRVSRPQGVFKLNQMASASTAAGLTRFGKLWGKGYETFTPSTRRIISVKGIGATKFLNGLLTCDLLSDPTAPRFNYEPSQSMDDSYPNPKFTSAMRSACFLDIKGRIVSI